MLTLRWIPGWLRTPTRHLRPPCRLFPAPRWRKALGLCEEPLELKHRRRTHSVRSRNKKDSYGKQMARQHSANLNGMTIRRELQKEFCSAWPCPLGLGRMADPVETQKRSSLDWLPCRIWSL